MIRKADILLAIFLLIGGIGLSLLVSAAGEGGTTVVIKHGSEIWGTYPLAEDREIVVETEQGRNVIRIENGQVLMEEASCPDQYCVHHTPIKSNQQSVICLPNRIIVSIEGGEEPAVDIVL